MMVISKHSKKIQGEQYCSEYDINMSMLKKITRKGFWLKYRNQFVIYMILSFGMIFLTSILFLANPQIFKFFIGPLNPILIIIFIALLGSAFLIVLASGGFLEKHKSKNLKLMLISLVIAPYLASIVILIDIVFRYPENINVLFPQSLIFYLVIAFAVEVLFHLIPFALLLIALTKVFHDTDRNKTMQISIALGSFIEPIYQMIIAFPEGFPLWNIIYFFGIHLVLFNVIQLNLFRHYGFLSMFLFRLIYYAIWHIIWGYFRLVLFF
ncbi:MAG: hypothetical protein GF383_10265 [Candidatus Lokiarchaeota archaeon]|nr:hypothetical protein [Candidatus Lokiarchaeota archaeon]MBD3340940.1 hypothetical protein [Candidatus Lokiarchaeota archaeon]